MRSPHLHAEIEHTPKKTKLLGVHEIIVFFFNKAENEEQ